jgi:hypothetical protein
MSSAGRLYLAALTTVLPSLVAATARAGVMGGLVQISTAGGSFPDVAYSTQSHVYLAVWGGGTVYGRLVSPTGQLLGSEITVSEAQGLFPDIAYNAQDDEFLVTWDDQRTNTGVPSAAWGQRIRASDGQQIGADFQIGDSASVRGTAVAWSPVRNLYLVIWRQASRATGRWVSAGGVPQGAGFDISQDASQALYATVEFGGNSFLVSWDCDCPGGGTIRGRCVPPGGTPGSLLDITTVGNEVRSASAYDPGGSGVPPRWLVQFTQPHAATGYDQYGTFVTSDCTPRQMVFPIANQPTHEGDTYFGADIAFLPGMGRYLSVFQACCSGISSDGTAVQELDREGRQVGPQVFIGTVNDGGQANAADPDNGRFLTVWHRDYSVIWGQLYEPVKPVAGLAGQAGKWSVVLTWTNPATADFVSTVVRCKASGFPAGPTDGELVVEQPGLPGAASGFTHLGLLGGVKLYYAAFARDSSSHYANPSTLAVTPGGGGDFDHDGDVDQEDFGHLQGCASGNGVSFPPGCDDADTDADGDVDAVDFSAFADCRGGPQQPSGC